MRKRASLSLGRIGGIILAALFAAALVPCLAFADGAAQAVSKNADFKGAQEQSAVLEDVTASGQCGDTLYWSYLNGVLTISGTGAMYEAEEFVGGDYPWLDSKYRELITTIYLPETLTSIGAGAFQGCSALTTVNIPSSITVIENATFCNCTSLKRITLPESVVRIGSDNRDSGAFQGCTLLEYINIPTKATSIWRFTFFGCTSLKEITVPKTVTSFGYYAFYCLAPSSTVYVSTLTQYNELHGNAYYIETTRTDVVLLKTNIASSKVTVDAVPTQRYTGKEITPNPTITYDGETLKLSRDYTLAYADNVEPGTATITVTGCGVFEGTRTVNFEIERIDIASGDVAVSEVAPQVYTGEAITPEPTITYKGEALELGRDYTLAYADNVNPGTATVTVTGCGVFTGTRTVNFEIKQVLDRVWGTEAVDTAAEIALTAFPDGCVNVVIARNDDFADALGAAGLAGALDAPIVLTTRNELCQSAKDAIATLGATHVYIIGGNVALKPQIELDLEELGIAEANIERVWGMSAADTSVECAKKIVQMTGSADEIIVAMGDNFQDALSISSYAYAKKVGIILLTSAENADGRRLTAEAQELLTTGVLMDSEVIVVGGEGAVQYAALEPVRGQDFERLWGWDGYDTSNVIAIWACQHGMSATTVCVANGAERTKGMDALAGAALAGKNNGVMLLANMQPELGETRLATIEGGDSNGNDSFFESNVSGIKFCNVLGGAYVMPDTMLDKLASLLAAK